MRITVVSQLRGWCPNKCQLQVCFLQSHHPNLVNKALASNPAPLVFLPLMICQGGHFVKLKLVVQAVKRKEAEAVGAQLQYTCRCSFLQIYNEQVSDLLQACDKPLTLRYDDTRGVFAEGLSEHVAVNGVLQPGSALPSLISLRGTLRLCMCMC